MTLTVTCLTIPLSCAVIVDILMGDNGRAIFRLMPRQIHRGGGGWWIAKAQQWVKEQMAKDNEILRGLAMEVVNKKKTREEVMGADGTTMARWVRQVEVKLLSDQPELRRYEHIPAALMVVFDLRARIRDQRHKPSAAAAAAAPPVMSRSAKAEEEEDDAFVTLQTLPPPARKIKGGARSRGQSNSFLTPSSPLPTRPLPSFSLHPFPPPPFSPFRSPSLYMGDSCTSPAFCLW